MGGLTIVARLSLLIDVAKCTGCYNCFLACRDEYYDNDYPPYSLAQPLNDQFWMKVVEVERGAYPKPKLSYIPIPCLHCESAPCMDAAKGGAVYRREDGVVLIDPEKAKNQESIVNACPYRVIYWNEETRTPQKCTLCAHRLDEGAAQPRCAESCPTAALVFGDLDDPDSEIAKLTDELDVEDFHPEFETRPLVKYVAIPKLFIAGEVVLEDQQDECAQGVEVILEGDDQLRETMTDAFGDFEFEGLGSNSPYRVIIRKQGYLEAKIEVTLKKDMNLGEVVLEPTA
jgi:Fe-S-cluster-containing dehydrogenase component